MILRQKEGVLKMSGKYKIYKGQYYEFSLGKFIGKGGNGKVLEADCLNPQYDKTCVVKILCTDKWRDKKTKELRYRRFNKEIHKVLEFQDDIPGVMKILDFYCPNEMQDNIEVWYLMHKAQGFREFSVSKRIDIKVKVEYLLELSNILSALHEKGYSHRDIKLDNILFLDNHLMLSDFGLIWNVSDVRITGNDERLGPFYIGPPELENRDIDMDDFRPSDVYLFSKVVWMVLKNDAIGFRGEYKRSIKQFYLDSSSQGVSTFEPMHQLLEQSTKNNMIDRITIQECQELLRKQLAIISGDIADEALKYRYKELGMEIVNNEQPDERIFRMFDTIFDILRKLTPISVKIIEGSNEIINADLINKWIVDKTLIFTSKVSSGHVHSYICYPDYIKYNKENEEFELYIKKTEKEDIHSEFVPYKESKHAEWGLINNNIFLNETLVICFKMRN